ncbi:hypothetical protein NEOKW01_0760 [Nematocida sp. AWRm80]|nr:hypothetical protein NEOKW01_0760 [Nematocida sp. AWRm80]
MKSYLNKLVANYKSNLIGLRLLNTLSLTENNKLKYNSNYTKLVIIIILNSYLSDKNKNNIKNINRYNELKTVIYRILEEMAIRRGVSLKEIKKEYSIEEW